MQSVGRAMTAKAESAGGIDPRVMSLLACPVCHGALRAEPERLACVKCGRGYPIVDGIPVLTPRG